ncbi:MAG: sigma-70 family RNA polymerase sigma factor [Phycisphaerae bacterium]|nr:sigma-70 family RNA polymerase sigma factor [Phycisphaerae bacterium]
MRPRLACDGGSLAFLPAHFRANARNVLAGQTFISYADVLMEATEIADVILRAQRHEPEAFDTLVDAYSSRLYGFFYRHTGSRHDAEDLLQEVFVRLVRRIGEYQHDGRFDAWLFRVAANLLRDRGRRAKRTREVGIQPAEADREFEILAPQPEGPDGRPDDPVERAEQLDRLQWALGQLSEAEREVILLRHFSDMSFRQIAEVMGTPLGTALARAHRGLNRLRELMDGGP